jgi:myosin heavy subunit
MSDEQKKQKRSRPKSEVVKSSSIDTGEKKKHSSRSKTAEDGTGEVKKSHSKKSHSHHVKSEKPAVEDRSAEIEQLKKDLEAANTKVSTLQQENETLASQAKKAESSSSSDNNQGEEIASLKSQIEEKNNACGEHERTIESLREEISTLKSNHESALEAEFEKLATAQKEIRALQEKNEELQKPKPIQGTKVVGFTQSSPPVNSALSPRDKSAQGAIPAWKQREMDKQKEAEEARQAESRAKLQKVASLRVTKNDIHTDTEHKNFKDPMDNKPSAHGGVIDSLGASDSSSSIVTDSISPSLTVDLSENERVEAEMARLGRTLKRGGHQV